MERDDEHELTWRPLGRDDVPALARLIRRIEQVDQAGLYADEAEIAAQFDHAGLDPAQDTLVGATPDGELVAYGAVYPAPAARDVQRLFLSGGVSPQWRGRGLGRRVLDWQVARAVAVHRTVRPHLPALVEVGGVDRDDPKVRLLRRAGFAPVRWWYEMACDLITRLPATVSPPVGAQIIAFDDDQAEEVRNAHNEAFAEHWGTVAVDQDVWRQRFSAAQGFRPTLSLVARDGGEVAAYLLSFVHEAEIAAVGVPTAHVGYLGTRRAWRRRGLARSLLTTAMHGYRAAGYAIARLVVDTENGSGALDLYRWTGFEVDRRWVTYGRRLAAVAE